MTESSHEREKAHEIIVLAELKAEETRMKADKEATRILDEARIRAKELVSIAEKKELEDMKLKESVLSESDKRYAVKMVERIVFGILGLVGTAIVIKLIAVVIPVTTIVK